MCTTPNSTQSIAHCRLPSAYFLRDGGWNLQNEERSLNVL